MAIEISDNIAEHINTALANGKPVAVTYVDAGGKPHMSLRGSTQVASKDQLTLWIRHRDGFADAIESNPNVGLLYRDSSTRTTIIVYGRAHEERDESGREAIFSAIPEPERDHDPERHGVAIVVDVDELSSITVGEPPIRMSR